MKATVLIAAAALVFHACSGDEDPSTELSFLGDGADGTSSVVFPSSTTLVASLRCADPTSNSAVEWTAQPEWIGESGWVVPGTLAVASGNAGRGLARLSYGSARGADDVVTCTYRGGAATEHPTGPEVGRAYLLEGCSDGTSSGTPVHARWASLQVESADCASTATSVIARLLPPPPADSSLVLRLTPTSVMLTDPNETRILTVRAFAGTEEVSTDTLGLSLEVLGDGIAARLLAGHLVAVRAARFPGWGALGIRSSTHGEVSTGTLVTSALLHSDVVEIRANELAMPIAGIDYVDPLVGEWSGEETIGVGPFTFTHFDQALERGPFEEIEEDESVDIAVVRSTVCPALVPGTMFASTDGEMFVGRVLTTEVSEDHCLVRFVPRSGIDALDSVDVDYDGQLSAAGYALDAANDAILRGHYEARAAGFESDGAAAAALTQSFGQLTCEVTSAATIGSATFNPNFAVNLRDFAVAWRNLPGGGTSLEARAYTRANLTWIIDFQVQLNGTLEATCRPSQSHPSTTTPIWGPVTLETEVGSVVKLTLTGSGGPTAAIRWSGNNGVDLDMGVVATTSGVVPHPAVQDLDMNGAREFVEMARIPSVNSDLLDPILTVDPGGVTGGAPVYTADGRLEALLTINASISAAPQNLLRRMARGTSNFRRLVDHLPRHRARAIRDALISLRWTTELLKKLTIVQGEVESGASASFRHESSGSILSRTGFDNTDYYCQDVQRLQFELVGRLRFGALPGLTDLIEIWRRTRSAGGQPLVLGAGATTSYPLVSGYTCLNHGTLSGYVQRDSRRCGMALESGETATLRLRATAPTSVVAQSLWGSSSDRAEVFLDPDGGPIVGAWTSLGTLPRTGVVAPGSGSSITTYEYEGSLELDSETARRFDGMGASTVDNSVRVLSWSDMFSLDVPNPIGQLRPDCGCVTDSDCGGDRCVRDSGAAVGVCRPEDDFDPEFIANHLRFRSPSGSQAITGVTCGGTEVTGVHLGAKFSFEHVVGNVSLYLDGERVANEYWGFQPSESETLAPEPRTLSPGLHSLAIRVEYEGGEGVRSAERAATFIVRIRPCCPDGQRFNPVTEVCEDDDLPCPPETREVNYLEAVMPGNPFLGQRYRRSCEQLSPSCPPCVYHCGIHPEWGWFEDSLWFCYFRHPTDECPEQGFISSGWC